jgi:hypothetical protein
VGVFVSAEGDRVDRRKAARKTPEGPTLRSGREVRQMRDALMAMAREVGCNAADIGLVFGLSRSQVYERLNQVEDARGFLQAAHPDLCSRRGI